MKKSRFIKLSKYILLLFLVSLIFFFQTTVNASIESKLISKKMEDRAIALNELKQMDIKSKEDLVKKIILKHRKSEESRNMKDAIESLNILSAVYPYSNDAGQSLSCEFPIDIDPKGMYKEEVKKALVSVGPAIAPLLVNALCDKLDFSAFEYNNNIFEILSHMGDSAKDAVPGIIDFILKRDVQGLNVDAISAITYMGVIDKSLIINLVPLLDSDKWVLRSKAAILIVVIGSKDIKQLKDILN